MSGRASFAIAQPIICIGFAMAAIILIVLLALASSSMLRLDTDPGVDHALSQAFYYAIWAAANYTIIDALMILTVVGAIKGKYAKEFNLSTSQRTLMLQTIAFMAYLLLGSLIYSKIEGWAYLDTLFWADYTLLTIGVGSPFAPSTHTGRALLFPFAIGGVITIGLIIGSIRSMLLEQGKAKMYARTTEKTRKRVYSIKKQKHGNYSARWRREEKHLVEAGIPPEERRRREFHAMRDVQENAQKKSRWVSLAASTFATSLLWFIGALVFKYAEYKQGWSYFVSLYFSYTSLITIGYGDLTLYSNSGRAFFVFWSILAIPTLTVLISDMGDTVVKGIADATNYVGTLTILPGEKHVYSGMKARLNMLSRGRLFKNEKVAEDMTKRGKDEIHRTGSVADLVATRFKDEDLFTHHEDFYPQLREQREDDPESSSEATEAQGTDPDIHFYRFLLAKEARNILLDLSSSSSKKYTYDEWAYFLRLLGHDESHPNDSSPPHQKSDKPRTSDNKKNTNNNEFPEIGRIMDNDGNFRSWSWLSLRSPLMSRREESEWILHALLARLQRELMHIPGQQRHTAPHSRPRSQRSSTSFPPVTPSTSVTQPTPPPVRLTEIRQRLRARKDEDEQAEHGDAGQAAAKNERRNLRRKHSDEEEQDVAEAQASSEQKSGKGQERGEGTMFPVFDAFQGRGVKDHDGGGGKGSSKTK